MGRARALQRQRNEAGREPPASRPCRRAHAAGGAEAHKRQDEQYRKPHACAPFASSEGRSASRHRDPWKIPGPSAHGEALEVARHNVRFRHSYRAELEKRGVDARR